MLKGFRDFILRGNVVDLAVAVVIGAAFSAIVNSLVTDLINPAIAAAFKKPDFSYLVLNIHGGHVRYGNFLNALIQFLAGCHGGLFLCRAAAQHADGKIQACGSRPPPTRALPAVPERYPGRCQALLALRAAGCVKSGFRSSISTSENPDVGTRSC